MKALVGYRLDPVIMRVIYWHQLPEQLKRRYAGRSQMGRIYALDLGGEVVYLWSEAGIYEEAAWHGSRLLDPVKDAQVLAYVA